MAVAHSVEAVLIHDAVAGTGVVDGGSVHEVLLYDDLLGSGWNHILLVAEAGWTVSEVYRYPDHDIGFVDTILCSCRFEGFITEDDRLCYIKKVFSLISQFAFYLDGCNEFCNFFNVSEFRKIPEILNI